MKKYVGNEAGDYQKVLITTNFFAKQAIEEAANEVELIEKIGLMRHKQKQQAFGPVVFNG